MATPIKETPILRGMDAVRFIKEIENSQPIPKEDYNRAMRTYEAMKKKNPGWDMARDLGL